MREVVATKDAPQAIGPYSQAIKANGFIFASGQIAIDPATQQVIAGDLAAQTDRVLRNLSEILEAAGSGLGRVVRTTVFLKNMGEFTAMNEVYAKYCAAKRQQIKHPTADRDVSPRRACLAVRIENHHSIPVDVLDPDSKDLL